MEDNFCKINDIKSTYILKGLFSHICNKRLLDLLRHNKIMQNKVKIDIEYYKAISNRILAGEKNGIGKEYRLNTRIVLFEGEYVNRKKNRKGKEYYENKKKNLKENI